jgi:hypothetical protein
MVATEELRGAKLHYWERKGPGLHMRRHRLCIDSVLVTYRLWSPTVLDSGCTIVIGFCTASECVIPSAIAALPPAQLLGLGRLSR